MNDFTAILSSDLSVDYYPENTTTCFKNSLPRFLHGEHEWCVALESISFDNTVSNLPKEISSCPGYHFAVFAGSARVLLSFEDKYYDEPRDVYARLRRQIPTQLISRVNVSLRQKRVIFRLSHCYAHILDSVCEWMNINTLGRASVYINDTRYFEFDARQKETIVVCERDTFAVERTPSFVKVCLEEMQPCLSGGGFHRDLAITPYTPPDPLQTQFYFEAGTKEYFPIPLRSLQDLTICLRDGEGKPLQLRSGQATVVKLKIAKMSQNKSFVMRLKSSDSAEEFPDNHSSRFRIQLPHTLSLDGDNWEVALLSMHYPSRMKLSTYLKRSDLYWYRCSKIQQDDDDEMPALEILGHFKQDHIRDVRDLINVMNRKIDTWIWEEHHPFISADEGGHLSLKAHKGIRICLSPKLAYLLFEIRVAQGEKEYEMSLSEGQAFLSPNPSNINRCFPQHILLCCDFITPTLMGGKYANVLKLIPQFGVEPSKKTHRSVNSNHLDFADVSTDKLSSINFELTNEDGSLVKFQSGEPTIVSLMFRRK